jgi:DNA-directed RNA polymerase subunit M/transcription elongation factor TFIIS
MAPGKRRSGDACSCGRGRYRAYSSRRCDEYQLRYMECRACGTRFRSVVKASEIERRK